MALQTFGVVTWMMLNAFGSGAPAPVPSHERADHGGGSAACETCHQFPATRSHVVGVRPTMAVPADLPLGSNGELMCVTCHDVRAAGASNRPSLLRDTFDASNLCTSCHTGRPDDGSRLAHAIRVGTAHAASASTKGGPQHAATSLECMTCHDGVIGADTHSAPRFGLAGSGLDLGHPVRINYANAQISSSTLKPAALLNAALRLENGEVGCTSCHDAFSRLERSLVMENRGSALCLSCHQI